MKKAIVFAAAALLAARAAGGIQEDFAAANRLYAAGDYRGALAGYRKLLPRSDDWQVPYNAGNCYYKLGRYLSAKFYYLKARQLRPLEPAVAGNIEMTNRWFQDNERLPEPDFVEKTRQRLEALVSMDALSLLLLAAAALANLFLFLLLTRGKSKWRAYALAFSLLLALLVGAVLVDRASAQGRRRTALVWAEGAELRSGPGAGNTVLFQIHPGLEVRVVDRSGGWLQVAASERVAGWIEKSKLALI